MFLFVLIDRLATRWSIREKLSRSKVPVRSAPATPSGEYRKRAGAVYQGLGNSEAFSLFRHFSRGQIEFGPARGSREQEQQLRRSDFRVAKALATMDDMAQPARSFQSMPNARREDNTG